MTTDWRCTAAPGCSRSTTSRRQMAGPSIRAPNISSCALKVVESPFIEPGKAFLFREPMPMKFEIPKPVFEPERDFTRVGLYSCFHTPIPSGVIIGCDFGIDDHTAIQRATNMKRWTMQECRRACSAISSDYGRKPPRRGNPILFAQDMLRYDMPHHPNALRIMARKSRWARAIRKYMKESKP